MGQYNHESEEVNVALGGLDRGDVIEKYQTLLADNRDSLEKISQRVELVENNMTPQEMAVVISVLTDEMDERIRLDEAMPKFLKKAVMDFRDEFQEEEVEDKETCNCSACTRRRELMAEHGITPQELKKRMKEEFGGKFPPGIEMLKEAITGALKEKGIEGVMSFAGTEEELEARGGIEGIIKEDEAAENKGIVRAGGEGGNA